MSDNYEIAWKALRSYLIGSKNTVVLEHMTYLELDLQLGFIGRIAEIAEAATEGRGMSAHTPGPWEADIRVGIAAVHVHDNERFNCLSGKRGMCLHWSDGERVEEPDGELGDWALTDEQVANAHLIAAAPDLLEAAKEALTDLNYYAVCLACTSPDDLPVLAKLKTAILKAEGEEA